MATLYRLRQNLSILQYEKKPYIVWLFGDVIKFYCDKSMCYDFAIHCAALIAAIAPSATAVAA